MEKNWIFIIVLIIIGVGLFSGCTQQESPPTTTTNTISIRNFAFSPSTLTVKVGTNVIWINEDSVTHQVREDSGFFESSLLNNGQSFTFTFTIIGTYNYTCTIHPSMTGKVIVE